MHEGPGEQPSLLNSRIMVVIPAARCPPCPSAEGLCCSRAADGLLGLLCSGTCDDLPDGGRSAEHGKMLASPAPGGK